MTRQLLAATRVLLALTVLLGVAYPLGITAVAAGFAHQAKGSPMHSATGADIGSALLGQPTTAPEWFHPRPSASDYSGTTSGGTNWGPAAPDLAADMERRAAQLRADNPLAPAGPVPADALTSSASGLDPDISTQYATWQAPRVAAARGLALAAVLRLVEANTTRGELGFLGDDRVNVATLNAALASAAG
jgi:K+-transporting ATPase ATPase C chain